MKNLMFLILLIPTLAANQNLDGISKAINSGDVESLSAFFDESVEIAILDNEDFYNKSQAKDVVKKFFARYQPKSFSLVHQGTSKGKDSKYFIGNLNAGGKSFRVYVYVKAEGGKSLIQELRFDQE